VEAETTVDSMTFRMTAPSSASQLANRSRRRSSWVSRDIGDASQSMWWSKIHDSFAISAGRRPFFRMKGRTSSRRSHAATPRFFVACQMTSSTRKALLAELGSAVRANQTAVDAVDDAAAACLGINRTDLRCIDVLLQEPEGSAIPARLAERLGISTGSVTALIDRLERLGYVVRAPDPTDRRKVIVRATDKVKEKTWAIYGPIAEEGARMLKGYSVHDLERLIEFMRRSRALQEAHLKRIVEVPR
jgi:DNA-binding MarR family transcriptional regulator